MRTTHVQSLRNNYTHNSLQLNSHLLFTTPTHFTHILHHLKVLFRIYNLIIKKIIRSAISIYRSTKYTCKCPLECKGEMLVLINFTSLVLISNIIALLLIPFIIFHHSFSNIFLISRFMATCDIENIKSKATYCKMKCGGIIFLLLSSAKYYFWSAKYAKNTWPVGWRHLFPFRVKGFHRCKFN